MSERKVWTPEEDRVLQEIIEVKKIKKWSAVARCMDSEYLLPGRTGKQCRQRWYNQLDPFINNRAWDQEEQNKMFEYHRELGNKWTKIAQRLTGRTDNNVKNHFYSTLRKGMRRMNSFLLEPPNRNILKPLSGIRLSKLIIVAEDKFERKLPVDDYMRTVCSDICDCLIILSRKPEENMLENICKDLAGKISYFCQNYKKKRPKKKKKVINCQEDEQKLPEVKEQYEHKPRQWASRSILQTIEPIKSQHNEEEEMPIDFPLQFFRNTFRQRSPCSPLNISTSLGLPVMFKLPQIMEAGYQPNGNNHVSLQASAGSSMFANLGVFWPAQTILGTQNTNIDTIRDQQPEPIPPPQ